MPITDYGECKIYKLVSSQTDKVYIGSTCQKQLSKRLGQHRQDYNRYLNGKKKEYMSSYEIVKYPDAKIILVQAFPDCQNNMERLMYEQNWIDCYDCVNKYNSYVSPEGYKEYHAEYRKNNKEIIAINNKEYYQKNKEQILEQNREKVLCECGFELTRACLSRHRTSLNHQYNLNILNINADKSNFKNNLDLYSNMDLSDLIRKVKPNLKDISIKRYVANLTKLRRDINGDDDFKFLEDTKKVSEYLNKKSDSTKKAYLNSIIVFLQATNGDDKLIKYYQSPRDTLNEDYKKQVSSNVPTEKEKEKLISLEEWDALIEKLDKLTAKFYNKSPNALTKTEYNTMLFLLINCLHRHIPLRNDYSNMKLVRTKREANQYLAKDPEHNVLLLSRMFKNIYLVNYKTSGTYGTKVIPMPDAVVSCVMRFLRVSKNNKWLISNFKGKPLSTTEYSKFLISNFEKHTGKKIGSSTLRKIYLSGKYGGVLQSMVEDADKMCHSINTQKIYIKNI